MGQLSVNGRARRWRAAIGSAGIAVVLSLVVTASASAATFNVACGDSAGLVNAINSANAGGGGVVVLASGCGTSYDLASAYSGEDGLPPVTTAVAVQGNGNTITVTGVGFRVFEVDGPGGNLTLDQGTITGGNVPGFDFGGGILNDGGTLTLNRSAVDANSAGFVGGGIASGTFFSGLPATTTVNNSQVNGNSVAGAGAGGGIGNGDYAGLLGAGFAPNSSLVVNNSQVNDNVAPGSGGGGIQNAQGNSTVSNSQVNGNTAGNGGGIASGNGMGGAPPTTSLLVVSNSQVDDNKSVAMPGGGPPLGAGGIANGVAALINNSEVDGNTSEHLVGGGIVNHGTMKINNSRIENNTANGSGLFGSAGGIANLNLGDGTFASGVLQINNSKLTGNSANDFGGAILNGAPNRGAPSSLRINNGLLTNNSAPHGGGIANPNGTARLNNTTVAGNTIDNCEPLNTITSCVN